MNAFIQRVLQYLFWIADGKSRCNSSTCRTVLELQRIQNYSDVFLVFLLFGFQFFSPLALSKILVEFGPDGRPKGEADVFFRSHQDAVSAMSRDRLHMGRRLEQAHQILIQSHSCRIAYAKSCKDSFLYSGCICQTDLKSASSLFRVDKNFIPPIRIALHSSLLSVSCRLQICI